MISGVTKL